MMRRPRRMWWFVFAVGAAAVVITTACMSVVVVRLERGQVEARREAQLQQYLGLALWRMETWLAPMVAREAARPVYEYLPYYSQDRAYSRILNVLEKGEVVTPSPLLARRRDVVLLHFQWSEEAGFSSPQVPEGNLRDLAESTVLAPETIQESASLLARVARAFHRDEVAKAVASTMAMIDSTVAAAPGVQTRVGLGQGAEASDASGKTESVQNAIEWTKRAQSLSRAQQQSQSEYADGQQGGGFDEVGTTKKSEVAEGEGANEEVMQVGRLVPVWMEPAEGAPGGAWDLCFVREVRGGGGGSGLRYQGFLCDWNLIRTSLLAETHGLLANPRLVPFMPGDTVDWNRPGQLLATIPALLDADEGGLAADSGMVNQSFNLAAWPGGVTLVMMWVAVLGAIAAGAGTLWAAIEFGERRNRFASAVTHELRTPLTTFRLYSEMLAEGMITDEAQRRTYLQTLRTESERLSTLVENVLAHARVEGGAEGGPASNVETVTVGELLVKVEPMLRRRAGAAEMTIALDSRGAGATSVAVDVDAVGQILLNLVDNACKYGRNGEVSGASGAAGAARIEVSAERVGRRVMLRVRDHGPGIEKRYERTIFAPFDRGCHGSGTGIPGVGLGLALSRGLARRMGGDLVLEESSGGGDGACFALLVPVVEGRR